MLRKVKGKLGEEYKNNFGVVTYHKNSRSLLLLKDSLYLLQQFLP